MNTDFVVMVRQTHHERHCILSLSKDQSNDCQDINYNEPVVIRVYLRESASSLMVVQIFRESRKKRELPRNCNRRRNLHYATGKPFKRFKLIKRLSGKAQKVERPGSQETYLNTIL